MSCLFIFSVKPGWIFELLGSDSWLLGSDSDKTQGFTEDSNLQFHGSIDKVIDFDLLGRSLRGHRIWTLKTGWLRTINGALVRWSPKNIYFMGPCCLADFISFIFTWKRRMSFSWQASSSSSSVYFWWESQQQILNPAKVGWTCHLEKGDLHYKLPMISYTKSVKPDSGHFHLQHLETQPTKMCIFC